MYRIRPLPILNTYLDTGIFTYRANYGQKVKVTFYSWYIEGAKEKIIVDTGISAADLRSYRGFECKEIQSFESALDSVGLKPEDIDIVIQTHLHYDHSWNTPKCKNARVVVQESELKFALSPHPVMWEIYNRETFKNLRFHVVRGDTEIIPGIKLIHAPGHTPGTQAVAVKTEKGLAVISGFCSIDLTFKAPPESMQQVQTPGTHTDALAAYDSAVLIKGLADILIPQHDPRFSEVEVLP
ncbi:MAG: N-acyl homoserine lactonase family protein [Firmicutes bacterium]|nr:N-acyl homoserine lactonase family protein [Bacillota bacterium]